MLDVKLNKLLILGSTETLIRASAVCRELGIRTVSIKHEDDPGPRTSDEIVFIPSEKNGGIIDRNMVLSAATMAHVDAIYMENASLAKDPSFRRVCDVCNIELYGPRDSFGIIT